MLVEPALAELTNRGICGMTGSFLFTQDFFPQLCQWVDVFRFADGRLGRPAHTGADRLVLDGLFRRFLFAWPLAGLMHPLLLVHRIEGSDGRHEHFQQPI